MAHKIPCLWNDCPNLLDGALKERYCRFHKDLRKKNQKERDETSELKNKKIWPKKKNNHYGPDWTRCRRLYEKKHPKICVVCKDPAKELDHIKPISEGGSRLNWSNLQWLCNYCHKMKTGLQRRNK